MTNNNYTSEQWAQHLAKFSQDTRRVTPILATQNQNAPKKGKKK